MSERLRDKALETLSIEELEVLYSQLCEEYKAKKARKDLVKKIETVKRDLENDFLNSESEGDE